MFLVFVYLILDCGVHCGASKNWQWSCRKGIGHLRDNSESPWSFLWVSNVFCVSDILLSSWIVRDVMFSWVEFLSLPDTSLKNAYCSHYCFNDWCRYPFHNALHHHVESIIISCLESKNNTIVNHLLQECNLIGKILQTDKHSIVCSDLYQVGRSFLPMKDVHLWQHSLVT